MMGQLVVDTQHHTRGLFFFQDAANPSNRNAAPLAIHEAQKSALSPQKMKMVRGV